MANVTLVTGGGGYVGTHTVKYLLDNTDDKVVIVDSFERSDRQFAEALKEVYKDRLVVKDVRLEDKEALSKALADEKVTDVIHCCAYIEVPEGEENPGLYRQKILTTTQNLLAAMKENNVKRIVFSSTAAAYGPPQQGKVDERGRITETHPLDASTVYGKWKVEAERAIMKAQEAGDIDSATFFRYFNVAGADPNLLIGEAHMPKETHALPLVILAGLGLRDEFTIYGNNLQTPDGTPVRDLIHVLDLANAHTIGLERMRDGRLRGVNAYNLGSGEGVSVRRMVDAVKKHLGKFKVKEKEEKRSAGEPDVLVASSEKAERELGWRRRYGFDDIVLTAVQWTQKLAEAGWYNEKGITQKPYTFPPRTIEGGQQAKKKELT